MICHIDGLVQDDDNSSALAMKLPQICTKPSTYVYIFLFILCGQRIYTHVYMDVQDTYKNILFCI